MKNLKTTWTVEPINDLTIEYNLDLENEMANILSAEITNEIDEAVIWQLIESTNDDWYPITLECNQSSYDQLVDWLSEHFGKPGKTYCRTRNYHTVHLLFENREDAMLTLLRWS